MKTYTTVFILLWLGFIGFSSAAAGGRILDTQDSIAMGPGYANDIYYSFENGVVASPVRNSWDIGFRTSLWTASIITNGASGVNLYTYPYADTLGWNSIDTSGIQTWPVLYDDENDWENGAFNRNGPAHPDYGWGKYNPISHDVVGDSVYIVRTVAGSYFKLWILRKNSIANAYYLRFAGLDGTGQQEVTLDINPYRQKNFVYYNFDMKEMIDREPDSAAWDILFTKYMAIQPNGTPYPVVGVLNNTKIYANMFYPVDPDFIDWSSQPLDSTKSPIGWDWKSFDMNTMTWTVADSTAFFVQSWSRDIYKLVFTKFAGTGSGKIFFESGLQSPSSVIVPEENIQAVSVYPNPAADYLMVNFDTEMNSQRAYISVYDLTGKMVFRSELWIQGHSILIRFQEAGLKDGFYVMKIAAGGEVFTARFVVSQF